MKNGLRVKVKGLVSAAQYNGSKGTITDKSEFIEENNATRVQLTLDSGNKLKIKPINFDKLEVQEVIKDLNQLECAKLLNGKLVAENGDDVFILREQVEKYCSEDEILDFGKWDEDSLQAQQKFAAAKLQQMSSEQISAQIKYQRDVLARDPSALDKIKASNPALGSMTYEQVMKHFEMMSSIDPSSLKQMANMQAEQSNPSKMKEMMSDMTPKQMRSLLETQKTMLKTNPAMADELRKTNPQMKNFTSDQIEEQLNMMSKMKDDQLQKIIDMQKSGKVDFDMMKDPEMLKTMMESNPMMKHISKETIDKQVEAMKNMSPEQMENMMKMAGKMQSVLQPAQNVYTKVNEVTGGNAKLVAFSLLCLFFAFILQYIFGVNVW